MKAIPTTFDELVARLDAVREIPIDAVAVRVSATNPLKALARLAGLDVATAAAVAGVGADVVGSNMPVVTVGRMERAAGRLALAMLVALRNERRRLGVGLRVLECVAEAPEDVALMVRNNRSLIRAGVRPSLES